MKFRHLIFPFLVLLSLNIKAQDVHYSYYQFAPAIVNPALTGAFYGNIRATGITRGQWFNVRNPLETGNQGFTSTSLMVDGNLPFGLRDGDWVSLGINLLFEGNTAGVIDTRRSFNGISAAYHLSLSKKEHSVLTAGIKYGTYGLAFSQGGNVITPSSLQQGIAGQDDNDVQNLFTGADMNGQIRDETNDFMFGLMLETPVGKDADIRIGIASDHFLEPRLRQDTTSMGGPNPQPKTSVDRISRRLNAFVQYFTDINEKITLNPSILYQSMGQASNLLFQGLVSYRPNPKKDISFNFGLGVRFADNMDVPFYLGADYKDWRVGLAFDTNVSGLTQATSNAGAYELAVTKVFSWEKKAEVKPIFICPRL